MEHTTKAPERATPVTITMNTDTFNGWLAELQGITDPEVTPCNPPNFLIDGTDDPSGDYFKIAAYLNTPEGTVIARHLFDYDMVKVTIRNDKPGPQLMRTVRWMLGEEGEAA